MAIWAVLKITDGTTSINLLSGPGFYLNEWTPAIAGSKSGGVWRDSPMADGRRLAFRRFGNVIETFSLNVSDVDQEAVIHATQDLRRLLETALDYWTNHYSTAPVWIEARAQCETESRYALIYDWRTPEDGNPYGPGFDAYSGKPSFEDWRLLIERGHWMDSIPGESNCVQLSSLHSNYLYGSDLILNGGFETLGGGGADVFANWTESAAGVSVGTPIYGARSARLDADAYGATVQQNCAVTPGASYLLTFYYKNESGAPGTYSILDITHGTTIINQEVLASSLIAKQFRVIFSAPAGCISVGILLTSTNIATFHIEYDNVTLTQITEYDFGQAASCDDVHFIANRFQPSQITHLLYYDSVLLAYSINLMPVAPPYDIVPNPIKANDIMYIGVADYAMYPGPFDSVVFNLLNNYVDGVTDFGAILEYYTAAGAWSSLIASDQTDPTGASTDHLKDNGRNILSFFPPSQDVFANKWVKTTVNGVFGWWIRFRFGGIVGAPRLLQVTDRPYSPTIPRLEIASDQLEGDITSLLSVWSKMNSVIASGATALDMPSATSLTVALRKQSRGADFIPYINITNDVQIPGISVVAAGGTETEHCDFPGRTAFDFTIIPGGTASCTITLASSLANNYLGEFRAFLRIGNTPSVLLPPTARLNISSSGYIVGDWVEAADSAVDPTSWRITTYDFGKISIPSGGTFDMPIQEIIFYIEFENNSAANQQCTTYDLVLVPIDECSASVLDSGPLSTASVIGNKYLSAVIDAFYPKTPLRAFSYYDPATGGIFPENLTSTLQIIGSTNLQAKPREALFAFFMSQKIKEGISPLLETAYRPKLYSVSRYLSMRGVR